MIDGNLVLGDLFLTRGGNFVELIKIERIVLGHLYHFKSRPKVGDLAWIDFSFVTDSSLVSKFSQNDIMERSNLNGDPCPVRKDTLPIESLIRRECNELAELLIRKNKAYGNALADPIKCFSKLGWKERLRARLDEKVSRIMRGEADNEDAAIDLAGGIIMERVITKMEIK